MPLAGDQAQAMPMTSNWRRSAGHRPDAGLCAEHGITADIELLPSSKVEEALTRLDRGDVRYRFVLGLSDLG